MPRKKGDIGMKDARDEGQEEYGEYVEYGAREAHDHKAGEAREHVGHEALVARGHIGTQFSRLTSYYIRRVFRT